MGIEINNLHIEYKNRLLFDDVNLSIEDGELIAIETEVLDGGTSLLKAIGGLLRGCEGRVLYRDTNLLEDPSEQVMASIGFVYEEKGLISLYSVFQNISLPLQFHSTLSNKEITDEVDRICDELCIDRELFGIRPHGLNDVQTRLVNLARALVVSPGLLLIDELEGGMSDDLLRDTMKTLRKRQAEEPMVIIMTTSSDIIMSHADRVFDIDHHQLVEQLE